MLRSKNYGGDTNGSLAAGDVSAGKKPKVKMFHSNMEGKTKIDAYQSKMFLPLLLFIVLAMASTRTAEAQFDFTVVNNTGFLNHSEYGFAKLQDYEHRYRLTSASHTYRSAAMWSTTQIDLREDFIIDFKLNFGNRQDPKGADGIVFVMHQLNTNGLIGKNAGYIGYAHRRIEPSEIGGNTALAADSIENVTFADQIPASIITPSFAVEFDTYSHGNEWDEQGHPSESHISYLQDAYIDAIDAATQIQNNWESVETGHDYCVRIKWVRTNGVNGNDGYDLITYVVERLTLELTQRHTMHFNTVSDLISSASASNPLVTWGITSGTGGERNKHEVEYVNFINDDLSKE